MNITDVNKPILCQCGCGTFTTINKCDFIRRHWQRTEGGIVKPGRATWVVIKAHAPAFENELGMIHSLDQMTRSNLGRGWFRRLAVAAQLFDLQYAIQLRTKGPIQARALARNTVKKWLVPQWPWLIRRLTLTEKCETKEA